HRLNAGGEGISSMLCGVLKRAIAWSPLSNDIYHLNHLQTGETKMSRHETVNLCGVEYIQPHACSIGDYGGDGSIGLANIRAIIEMARGAAGEVFETWFSVIAAVAD